MKFNRALTLRILILKGCFNVCLLNVVFFWGPSGELFTRNDVAIVVEGL